MCGRFGQFRPLNEIAAAFDLTRADPLPTRYNIAPTQSAGFIRQADDGRALSLLSWGLVPAWAKDRSGQGRMINARAESVFEKPAFRGAIRRRRGIVPADCFYEWARRGRERFPHAISRADGAPMALAGVWERWEHQEPALESFSILTTTANERMAALHDRMPVILAPDDLSLWLAPDLDAPQHLAHLLAPCPSEILRLFPVGPYVNRVGNEGLQCLDPAQKQETLF